MGHAARSFLVNISWLLVLPFVACSTAPICYSTNGLLPGTDLQPCNHNLTTGAHSACCNPSLGDICLSSGLCISSNPNPNNRLLWASGCTDQTGQDQSCQQYCKGRIAQVYALQPCASGGWCCYDGLTQTTDCCNDASNIFELTPGSVIDQSGPSVSSTPQSLSCPKNRTTLVGACVGAILGSALLASLGAIIFLQGRLRAKGQTAPQVGGAIPNGKGVQGVQLYHKPELDGSVSVRQELDGGHVG